MATKLEKIRENTEGQIKRVEAEGQVRQQSIDTIFHQKKTLEGKAIDFTSTNLKNLATGAIDTVSDGIQYMSELKNDLQEGAVEILSEKYTAAESSVTKALGKGKESWAYGSRFMKSLWKQAGEVFDKANRAALE